MIFSAVIVITPENDVILPACTGNYIHGFMFNFLSTFEGINTTEMHEDKGASSFTVSPINGHFEKVGKASILLKQGLKFWFRITVYDVGFSEKVMSEFMKIKDRDIIIAESKFSVLDIILDNSEHEWAGTSNYSRIYRKYVIDQKDVLKKINLRFDTPTTFSAGKHNLILPLPETVFNNLLEKWIRYGEVPFSKIEFLKWVGENIVVSRYDLRTRMWDFKKYKYVGFVGNVEFLDVSSSDSLYRCLWNVLADFAFYAGIGAKTTMGMGMVKRTEL